MGGRAERGALSHPLERGRSGSWARVDWLGVCTLPTMPCSVVWVHLLACSRACLGGWGKGVGERISLYSLCTFRPCEVSSINIFKPNIYFWLEADKWHRTQVPWGRYKILSWIPGTQSLCLPCQGNWGLLLALMHSGGPCKSSGWRWGGSSGRRFPGRPQGTGAGVSKWWWVLSTSLVPPTPVHGYSTPGTLIISRFEEENVVF